jgi:hypothetical protein
MDPRDLENVEGTIYSEYNENWIRKRRQNLCLPQRFISKEFAAWNLLVKIYIYIIKCEVQPITGHVGPDRE